MFCGNNTNDLSCCSQVFINWNALIDWYNGTIKIYEQLFV
jgi:hypothetical protein